VEPNFLELEQTRSPKNETPSISADNIMADY